MIARSGLALCGAANCTSWESYDQRTVIPKDLRASMNGIVFPGKGKCSKDPSIIHQYHLGSRSSKADPHYRVQFSDIIDYSCLNGWTCGNIAATVGDISDWYS